MLSQRVQARFMVSIHARLVKADEPTDKLNNILPDGGFTSSQPYLFDPILNKQHR